MSTLGNFVVNGVDQGANNCPSNRGNNFDENCMDHRSGGHRGGGDRRPRNLVVAHGADGYWNAAQVFQR